MKLLAGKSLWRVVMVGMVVVVCMMGTRSWSKEAAGEVARADGAVAAGVPAEGVDAGVEASAKPAEKDEAYGQRRGYDRGYRRGGRANYRVNQAEQALKDQDFEEAAALLEGISIDNVSRNYRFTFLYVKGMSNKRIGNPQIACITFAAIMKHYPGWNASDTQAYLDITATLYQCGSGQYAEDAAQVVIRHSDDKQDLVEAYFWRGKAQMLLGDFRGAAYSFQESADYAKSGLWHTTALYEKANALASGGWYHDALDLYDEVKKKTKGDDKKQERIDERIYMVEQAMRNPRWDKWPKPPPKKTPPPQPPPVFTPDDVFYDEDLDDDDDDEYVRPNPFEEFRKRWKELFAPRKTSYDDDDDLEEFEGKTTDDDYARWEDYRP